MALRRQNDMLSAFSMASMTDVIFLLLVFFMVTSTYIFPTAIDVNLPQGTEQTPTKPSARIYIDVQGNYYVALADAEPAPVAADSLSVVLNSLQANDSITGVAVYADADVAYGKVVEVLNLGAANSLKMVLATRPGAENPSSESLPAQTEDHPE